MKSPLLFIPGLLLISYGSLSQISYGDVYKLLENKQYDEAEPDLRKYLAENKTPIASALIFMGNIYYEKALEGLMDEDQNGIRSLLDSALKCYQSAQTVLTPENFNGKEKYYKAFLKKKGKVVLKKKVTLDHVNEGVSAQIAKIQKKLNKLRDSEEKKDSLLKAELKRPGKYIALVIGISNYNNARLNLDRPLKDAQRLRQVLTTHYTFDPKQIIFLTNPTRQQIIKELFGLRKKVGKKDNLLIFYAGHGHWDEAAKQGYWWPRDASPDDPANWLSNGDLKEQIRGIPSSHTLVISDACFSGAIFKTRSASEIKNAPADIVMLYRQQSRRAITSGTLTTVPDQSVFFDHLVKQMTDNKEKYISSQFLFDAIRQRVINNSMIVPQDGVINDTGDEGGDFIFIRKN
jgi:Caspase domain